MTARSSYGAAAQEICELFADYLEGDGGRPAVAIGGHAASPAARNAIEKSLEAFGYGSSACTFVSLSPLNEQAEGGDIALDPQALFLLVEGLDPLYVISIDANAAAMLGKAYRTEVALDAPARLFGRSSALFANLDALLETAEGKQRAWRILKTFQA